MAANGGFRSGRAPDRAFVPTLSESGQLGERLGQLLLNDLLLVYFQPVVEPLVEQAPLLRVGQEVGPVNVAGQFERTVKGGEHFVMLDAQILNAHRGANSLSADALLLLGEQRLADFVVVVGRQQLALLLIELNKLHFSLRDLLGGQDGGCFHLALDGGTDALALGIAQLQLGIVILNGRLDSGHPVARLRAVGLLATAAHEVVVDPAIAGGVGVDQASAAVLAQD